MVMAFSHARPRSPLHSCRLSLSHRIVGNTCRVQSVGLEMCDTAQTNRPSGKRVCVCVGGANRPSDACDGETEGVVIDCVFAIPKKQHARIVAGTFATSHPQLLCRSVCDTWADTC